MQRTLALLSALGTGAVFAARPDPAVAGPRIPVILDSDIGDDIDDTWALLMLLRMPQFDVKLVVSDFGNAIYRSRLFAKLLALTGRTDIPIGVGLGREDKPGAQSGWIGNFHLDDYPGTVHHDGVQALIDTIKQSPEPVVLICIGPVPNIAAAFATRSVNCRKCPFFLVCTGPCTWVMAANRNLQRSGMSNLIPWPCNRCLPRPGTAPSCRWTCAAW